ncbi:Yersinia protein of uncharacterised function (DUF3831) [Yersinia enterocolitica]|nr:Yersinia protein of uncharacterised function (DUF3831) [Yersinia enterocolitica]
MILRENLSHFNLQGEDGQKSKASAACDGAARTISDDLRHLYDLPVLSVAGYFVNSLRGSRPPLFYDLIS